MSSVNLPTTLSELWSLLGEFPNCSLYAGGTDIFPALKIRTERPENFICLERLSELKSIRWNDKGVEIGSACTHNAIIQDPFIGKFFPILRRALLEIGSPAIRSMGTIGGNICTASPGGDSLPALYALNASLVLENGSSERVVPISEFIKGPGVTDLHPGEVLTRIRLQKETSWDIQHFEKVGKRKALACSIAGLAALVNFDAYQKVSRIHLAWGSVGPTVLRFPQIERDLCGRKLNAKTLKDVAASIETMVQPITDIRASEKYRRKVAGLLLLRLLAFHKS